MPDKGNDKSKAKPKGEKVRVRKSFVQDSNKSGNRTASLKTQKITSNQKPPQRPKNKGS